MHVLSFCKMKYFHEVENTPLPLFQFYGKRKQYEEGFHTDAFLKICRIVALSKNCEMLIFAALKESLCNQENLIN